MIGVLPRAGASDWASRPHRIATRAPPRRTRASMARSVTDSQPLPRCEPGAPGPDGQHAVEQQHPLVGPGREVSVVRRLDPLVVAELAVDVLQAARERTNVALDREAEADGVPRRRVGVLSDDQHLDLGQWPGEGPQDGVAGRQEAPPGGDLLTEELAELGDRRRGRLEHLGPVGRDQVTQRRRRHGIPLCPRSAGPASRWRPAPIAVRAALGVLVRHAVPSLILGASLPKALACLASGGIETSYELRQRSSGLDWSAGPVRETSVSRP